MGVAMYIGREQSAGGDKLFRSMVTLFSVAVAPVAVPMLAGLVTRKVTTRAALAGFLIGVTVGLVMLRTVPDAFHFGGVAWKQENAIFFGTLLTTLLVTTIVSVFDPARAHLKPSAGEFMRRLESPIGTLPEDRSDSTDQANVISPFRVVGTCTAIVGVMLIAVTPWTITAIGRALDLGLGAFLLISGVYVAWRSGAGPGKAPATVRSEDTP